jgi:ribosomal protein S18 acetylase RimI-like enzyme
MISAQSISYKHIDTTALEEVVQTHKAAFPDYFLTNLGDKFLAKFYRTFLEDENTIAIGAFDQDKLVGFILCSKNKSEVMKKFYQNNFTFIILSILIQVLKMNKIIISGLLSRCKMGIGFVKSLLFPEKSLQTEGTNVRLLSIAVLPEYKGTGTSKGMMNYFHNHLQENNIKAVGLSVKKDNSRAISFYEKMGWITEKEDKNAIYFVKVFESTSE